MALIAEMKRREGQLHECLDILRPHNDIDVNIRYIKILVNIDLNRFDEVFRLARITTDSNDDNGKNVPKIPNQLVTTTHSVIHSVRSTNTRILFCNILASHH